MDFQRRQIGSWTTLTAMSAFTRKKQGRKLWELSDVCYIGLGVLFNWSNCERFQADRHTTHFQRSSERNKLKHMWDGHTSSPAGPKWASLLLKASHKTRANTQRLRRLGHELQAATIASAI